MRPRGSVHVSAARRSMARPLLLAEIRRRHGPALDDADLGGVSDLGRLDRDIRIESRGPALADAGEELAIHRNLRSFRSPRNIFGLRLAPYANCEHVSIQLNR